MAPLRMAAEKQRNKKGDRKDKSIREKRKKKKEWGHGESWIYTVHYNEDSFRKDSLYIPSE